MLDATSVATFLFTDIEGSTALWERQPERMRPAMAAHDRAARAAVQSHGGIVVKMTGDGLHAAFDDAHAAACAALALQHEVARIAADHDVPLKVRCGMHAGAFERRDADFYGPAVNRAARIMAAAHGGQTLLSEAVARQLASRLPQDASLRDLGAVRLRDLASVERIYQLAHPELRAEFPPLRSLEHTPNNLPNALNAFIGRERELATVTRLLRANRLVTIVGMGGLGKSRLSMHVAAELLDDHPDGVWLVELAPLRDAARVPQAIATALGVQAEAGGSIEHALERHVRERTLLVVLDNCEHLIDGCAGVARALLSAGPGLRILATSREPLRLAGEVAFPLSGLPVPGPRAALATGAAHCDSVRLFVERAAAASPAFALDDENGAAVAAICHRLDGIPLAIELAAARVRALPVVDIAARMKDRFRLLTAGDPTAWPHQRTLRAMIDWSYDLLPADEQALFRHLAVFAGGCTLEAAERVCGAEEREAVLDRLCRLVEKSLVLADGGRNRYYMLETVRDYALQRLADANELDALGEKHLHYYGALCASAKPLLTGPQQLEWLERLDDERENLVAALAFACRSPTFAPDALRLVDAAKLYWAHRGMLELGHRLTEEALAAPGAQEPTALRATVAFNLGQFRYFMGRYDTARASLEESVAIARRLADRQVLALALQNLGMVAIGQGDLVYARPCLEESVRLASAIGDKRWLAGAINALAMLLRVEGDYSGARGLYENVRDLAREAGEPQAESVALLNLAMVCVELDEPCAQEMLRTALEIAARIDSAQAMQSGLEVCAGLACAQRDWLRAARFFGAAEAFGQRTGTKRDAADDRFLAPRMENARAALDEAAFDAAQREGAQLAPERAVGDARSWLALAVQLQPS